MLKKIFFTGLAAIVPVALTVYVLRILFIAIYHFMTKVMEGPLQDYLTYQGQLPEFLGIILGIFITVLIIFVTGGLVHLSRMRLSRLIERMFFRLPLVDRIYFPIKYIVDFLFFPRRKAFKSVVLVEYPRQGIYSIGFITNESSPIFDDKTGKKLYNIFISSSPSPLTGFTIFVEKSAVTFLDMSVENAIKLIISGGLLNPGISRSKDT